jgi:hypothetical protein
MARNARIPKIDRTNRLFLQAHRLLAKLADLRCEDSRDFWLRSMAARGVLADLMWEDEQQRLEEACTVEPEIMIDGEKYRRLSQASSVLVHGLWGGHVVREPLYRLVGVHNGPTTKPLLRRLGVVDQSLLPDLANEAGALLSKMTSRDVEETLQTQGFRPPSRTTLRNRLGGLLEDMSTTARELEEQCREHDELDFELGAITCGLDRFAARMDETLPEGPERDEKLRARRPSREYQRTPPEPYVCSWRMAWAANVTLYDTEGRPRRSFRYGADAEYGAQRIAARVVDDIVHLCHGRRDVHVACIQDGAGELEVLRRELQERLPEGVPRQCLVDFHHAVGYLDAIVAAEGDDDPNNMAGWYRMKLLKDDNGAAHIVEHLRRRVAAHERDAGSNLAFGDALANAVRYFENRRPLMKYAEAKAANLPVGSGATESTCGLLQLRVKHPGSHWRPLGLRRILAARSFELSGRWEVAFRLHHATLKCEVHPP